MMEMVSQEDLSESEDMLSEGAPSESVASSERNSDEMIPILNVRTYPEISLPRGPPPAATPRSQ